MKANTMNPIESSNYYLGRLDKYWKQFGRIFRSSDKILPKYLEAPLILGAAEGTKKEFGIVLLELPYIGGDKNTLTFTFVSGAIALAYIRTLEKRGLPVDTIGIILNEVYSDVYTSLPEVAKMFLRWSEFSSFRRNSLKAFAKESQIREYPENWVMEYIEGDGKDFDYGCNYTECAIRKFYCRMGAGEYMPYLCATDMTYSNALRLGLHRSQTLNFGGDYCDFRYKRIGSSTPGLPLEDLPEYQNRST